MMTATTTDNHFAPAPEHYFNYLTVVAESQMNARLRAKVDAGDVVQETMQEAHRDFEKFRGKSDAELRAWLRIILWNNLVIAARYYSRQKRGGQRELTLNSGSVLSGRPHQYRSDIDPLFPGLKRVQQEQSEKLAAALQKLLADEQKAVVMKYLHNRSVAEIALHLGRTQEAVAGLLRRGMKKLRTQLTDEISFSYKISV